MEKVQYIQLKKIHKILKQTNIKRAFIKNALFCLSLYLYRKKVYIYTFFNRFLNKLIFLSIFEIYISNNKKLLKKNYGKKH